MAVSDGQLVNSNVTNAAFLSRTTDSDTIGKIDLKNVGSPVIIDVQQAINYLKPKSYTTETISGGVVSSENSQYHQIRRVVSNGGNQTLNAQPFGAGGSWIDGLVIELMGTHATQTLTVQHSDTQYGAIINGDLELIRYQRIVLRYDSFFERWIEIARN